MLDSDKDEAYPPTHKAYWNAADAYLMGNVTPGGVFCATPHTKKKPKKKSILIAKTPRGHAELPCSSCNFSFFFLVVYVIFLFS